MKTCPKCGDRLHNGWRHLCNGKEYFNVRLPSQLDRIEEMLKDLVGVKGGRERGQAPLGVIVGLLNDCSRGASPLSSPSSERMGHRLGSRAVFSATTPLRSRLGLRGWGTREVIEIGGRV